MAEITHNLVPSDSGRVLSGLTAKCDGKTKTQVSDRMYRFIKPLGPEKGPSQRQSMMQCIEAGWFAMPQVKKHDVLTRLNDWL